jgi:transcriptional regulator with XRE-family HTH domain
MAKHSAKMAALGEKLKILQAATGKSCDDVARELGVSRSHIYQVRSGLRVNSDVAMAVQGYIDGWEDTASRGDCAATLANPRGEALLTALEYAMADVESALSDNDEARGRRALRLVRKILDLESGSSEAKAG